MTLYTLNPKLNGIEIYFPSKPDRATLDQLKAQRWRWHRVKKCWYTKQSPEALETAEQITNGNQAEAPPATEKTKAKTQEPTPYQVGEILYNSWGYEQTNIDFYQVTRCTAKTVWLRPIGDKPSGGGYGSGMDGHKVATPNEFKGPEIMKRIQRPDKNPYISFKHGAGAKWNGEPVHYSWYY